MLGWLFNILLDGSWVFVPWVAWGIIPFVAVNIGFWGAALPLEFILAQLIAEEKTAKGQPAALLSFRYWFRTVDYSATKTRASISDLSESPLWIIVDEKSCAVALS